MRNCIAPRGMPHHSVRVMRMPGDGSCVFHSIAFGLKALGYEENGHMVRQKVARFITERPDTEITGTPLRCWIEWDSRMSVSSYAARLAEGNCWGGAIEIAACAQIFAVDFAVYEEEWNGGGYRRISDFITDAVKPYGAVLLLYSGRAHYDAMQYLGGAAGPAISHGSGHGNNVSGYGSASAGLGDFNGQHDYRGMQHPRDDEEEWACPLM